jgi:hypothetical protein
MELLRYLRRQKPIVALIAGLCDGLIDASSNSGVTWMPTTAPSNNWGPDQVIPGRNQATVPA